jgi:hypothetical protein
MTLTYIAICPRFKKEEDKPIPSREFRKQEQATQHDLA